MNTLPNITGRRYTGPQLLQIAMPMGGIGAGCICLNGHGGLQDYAIHNRPATTAWADVNSHAEGTGFGIVHVKGERPVTRLLEGPMPPEKIYDQALQGQGYRHAGYEGMPRFRNCSFEGAYPFGQVELSDAGVPLAVQITGYSPFIPLDDKNSGIPAAILEYTFQNTSVEAQEFEFSYHVSHPGIGDNGREAGAYTRVLPGRGVYYGNEDDPAGENFGSFCLMAIRDEVLVKGEWFRGWWFDSISALWREVAAGAFVANEGSEHTPRFEYERRGGSILFSARLAPGEGVTFPLALAWHFPNPGYHAGGVADPEPDPASRRWRPYYAGIWNDAQAVGEYVLTHYDSLRARTAAFAEALHSSTLPPEVLEAVSANLAILKSPTVLRQENGNLWAWEGSQANYGSCHGSCTHVWNYAQALPHLFPNLERTLRESELVWSMDEHGHVNFRSALPDGPTHHKGHAAADGQLGGILKVWREWQISGDQTWLNRLYPLAKRSLEYCIRQWDPERRGALFEPHHNTYDIEFWGPDGMCGSIYLGALSAMAEMASVCQDADYGKACRELAERAASYLEAELFNGEYFQQNVMYRELRDQSFVAQINAEGTNQTLELLRREGPKYQYGSGCLSDGIIGGWMAELYGARTPLDPAKVRSTLEAIFRHNFRESLWDHVNLQRPGYAIGDEAGLLLCTWPRGGKPTLPFVYSDEVWTGIEYQVASHLILHGLLDEGLAIVRGARSRYEGHVRNPFNEYECGSYYARALASYALLQSLSGFRYSAVTRTLEFGPRLAPRPFSCFFSAASGFGRIVLEEGALTVHVLEGELALQCVVLTLDGVIREFVVSEVATPGQPFILNLI